MPPKIGTARIYYVTADGRYGTWNVACSMTGDNEETMREHLKRYCPDCTFLGVTFIPDAD